MEDQIRPTEAAAINDAIALLEQTITEARMALVAKNASGFTDSLERAERRANAAVSSLRRIRLAHLASQRLFRRSESSL